MNELIVIWTKLPGEGKLLLVCFIGSTVNALRNKSMHPLEALLRLVTGVIGGGAGGWIVLLLLDAETAKWWVSGIFWGYLGNSFWVFSENAAKPVVKDPWTTILNYVRDAMIKKPKASDENESL